MWFFFATGAAVFTALWLAIRLEIWLGLAPRQTQNASSARHTGWHRGYSPACVPWCTRPRSANLRSPYTSVPLKTRPSGSTSTGVCIRVVSLLQTSVAAGASGPLIVLSGVADISTIAQLSELITSQLSEVTRQLMIDVSGLHFADSAAIALLLLVARTLKGQGGSMVLIRPQPAVARAVTLADPDQIITIQGRTPHTPKSEGGRGSPG